MAKKMRSIQSGVVFDYNEAKLERYGNLYEVIEEEKPKPRRRRKKKVEPVESPNELDDQ